MDNIFNYIFMIALLAWSGYHWWKILDIALRRKSSKMWPLVIGKVTKKDVSIRYGSKGGKTYISNVSYSFSVMGTEITRTVTLGNSLWEKNAKRMLEEVGQTIKARYNPLNPNEHISEIEKVQLDDYFGALLPLLFLVGLVVITIYGRANPGANNH